MYQMALNNNDVTHETDATTTVEGVVVTGLTSTKARTSKSFNSVAQAQCQTPTRAAQFPVQLWIPTVSAWPAAYRPHSSRATR